ncbi:hypothetical protein GCM10009744_52720 [Kribbella alba]|uniref:HNH nuclease domain-containing protein n=1 Tax=Kribbella alba TaxID=190197 RepID=A0ABN2FMQ3_9ACTN
MDGVAGGGIVGAVEDPPDADQGVSRPPVWLHVGQARAIVAVLDKVPVEDVVVAEEQLVEAGREFSPVELRRLGRQVLDILDPDGREPGEDRAYDRESLQLRKTDHGVRFHGYLANENAEVFNAVIFDNAKPHKTIDGRPDPRSKTKRQADALTTAITVAADSGQTGNSAIKPHISVTIDYHALTGALTGTLTGTAPGEVAGHAPAGTSRTGPLPGIDLLAGLTPTGRLGGIGRLGGGGVRAGGCGELIYGGSLSASAVRRLACDAGILPVVLGSNSRPLDVGTEKRFVTDALRQALIVRDRGCVVCGAPPIMCDAHHLVHWAEGGPTTLDNLVLLCKHDHRGTHNGYWDIAIVDGVVSVARPDWADPAPVRLRPRRPPPAPPDPPASCPGAECTPATDTTTDTAAATETATGTATDSLLPSTTDRARSAQPARAWPYTTDIAWISAEETARLNPWGDDEPHQPTPPRPRARPKTDITTCTSPWGDEHDPPTPGPEPRSAAAPAPWGDEHESSTPGP